MAHILVPINDVIRQNLEDFGCFNMTLKKNNNLYFNIFTLPGLFLTFTAVNVQLLFTLG
jgi:hypothetical protein